MSAYDHLPHALQQLIYEKIAIDCTDEESDHFFELCERFGILSEHGESATEWHAFYDECYVDLDIDGAPEGSMELLKYADADWYEGEEYRFVSASEVINLIEAELAEGRSSFVVEDRHALEKELSMLLSGVVAYG